MPASTVAPDEWIRKFNGYMETFKNGCDDSLQVRGDFLAAPWPYRTPRFLFERDTFDLFGSIVSLNQEGFRGCLLNEFKDYIHYYNNLYGKAYELFVTSASETHSLTTVVVDLVPVGFVPGTSCEQQARYHALCKAYDWLHVTENINSMRDSGEFPSMFLTDECIFLYTIILRGKIGKWLVDNHNLWIGLA